MSKMRTWLYKKALEYLKNSKEEAITDLGGFYDTKTFLSFLEEQGKKEDILNELVSNLFNTITEKDILQVKANKMSVGEKILSEEETKYIREESDGIVNGNVWKYLKRDLQYIANRKMYYESVKNEDLTAGKLVLFIVQSIENRLKTLATESKTPMIKS